VEPLVLNPGSSSLKFACGGESGVIEHARMAEATAEVLARFPDVDAVGVRVVHGGSRFVAPTIVDDAVLDGIRELSSLAPLHNPLAVEVIEEVRRTLPNIPIVAVFDTAFHQTMPEVASTYAVPPELGVRRYGFHGISYAYIASRIKVEKLIACHLGNGASVCAMRDGKSVDTSMGLTPLEGLVMGTRAGDIDPGVVVSLARQGVDVDDLLNHRAGLLGLSGISADVRTLQDSPDPRAQLALDVFAYRVAKYVGAYAAVLGGVDALVFTAGIGEHSATVRARVCSRLTHLGIILSDALNRAPAKSERLIGGKVWVVPTNEEAEIARATAATISSPTGA
jgi:acetate kinase